MVIQVRVAHQGENDLVERCVAGCHRDERALRYGRVLQVGLADERVDQHGAAPGAQEERLVREEGDFEAGGNCHRVGSGRIGGGRLDAPGPRKQRRGNRCQQNPREIAESLKKLADIGNQHGRLRKGKEGDELLIELKLSQEEWGDMVGTTRESINKQFGAWAKEGLIRMESGLVVVTDLDELEKLADCVVI